MKPKLKYLYALAAILVLCGCEYKPKTYVGNSRTIWVDTINIHGNSHEVLFRAKNYGQGGVGGMMHSPECWCGKGGRR